MGISQIHDQFYEKVLSYKSSNIEKLLPGQIVWVPTPFLDKNMLVIEFERAKREDHNNIKFEFKRLNSSHFKKKSDRLPIPNITLNETEELMAFKAKKRPCIFLGKAEFNLCGEEKKTLTRGKKHLLSKDYLFLPIYSTHQNDELKGFPTNFVLSIKHFLYTHLVYLPACTLKDLKTNLALKEGIIRLDRLFVTSPVVPNISPTDIKIHDDYMKIIKYHIKEYLLKETNENLKDLRNLLKEVYDELAETDK